MSVVSSSWKKTLFTSKLFAHPSWCCRLPIMGAPMAGVSGGRLAAATTRAGALGFIAAGHLLTDGGVESLQQEIQLYRQLMMNEHTTESESESNSAFPLAIGFIGHSATSASNKAWDRYQYILQHEKPDVVQFFAPSITQHPQTGRTNVELAHDAGVALFLAQVGTVQEGLQAIQAGVDGIIAQGAEAGGHGLRHPHGNPVLALTARLRQLAAPLDIPVLAAGGLVDGRSVAAALTLGADGVVLGTRLWASNEALGHDSFKQAIVAAKSCDDAIRTTCFDQIQNSYISTPWPVPYDSLGALKNDFSDQWDGKTEALDATIQQQQESSSSAVVQAFRRAQKNGDASLAPVLAGKGVGEIHSIEPAGDIIARIDEEARTILLQQVSTRLLQCS